MGNAITISDALKQKEKGGFVRTGNVPISTHILIPPQTESAKIPDPKLPKEVKEPKITNEQKKTKKWKEPKNKKNDTEPVKE